jgi:hypothetical protein
MIMIRNWLTLPRLLTIIVFIAIFAMAVRTPADTDTWWHLRSGQYIVETRGIPTTDPFSHTFAGQPLTYHGWLSQVFWYGLFALGGWAGLSLSLAVLVTCAFWLVWQVTPGNLYIRAFSIILGAITSAVVWVARPHMLSFVLAGLILLLLEKYKRSGSRWIYALPLITMLWANIHGGYAIAFMLVAAYLVGETFNHLTGHRDDPLLSWSQLAKLVVVALVSFAVVVVNPHGWQTWAYPFRTVGIGALRDYIQEWRSPDFHLSMTWPFAAMLLLTLVAAARSGRRADWTDLALVGLWATWSLFAGRNIGLYGLLTVPVLARYADSAWGHYLPAGNISPSSQGRAFALLNWSLLALVVVGALIKIALPLSPQATLKVEEESLPAGAVRFIQAQKPAGPLFNSYNWGGYLIFKLWPDYLVYIDGRTDLYDDAFIRRYLDVMVANDGWQQILDDDGINLVLIENNSVLDKFLRISPAWQEVYRDKMAVIFTRKVALP